MSITDASPTFLDRCADSKDCIMAIASGNGSQSLERHDFELCYSRRDNNRIVASLIAVKNGVIDAKIEPEADGRDQARAFWALKIDIEKRMDKLLESVPNLASYAGGIDEKDLRAYVYRDGIDMTDAKKPFIEVPWVKF